MTRLLEEDGQAVDGEKLKAHKRLNLLFKNERIKWIATLLFGIGTGISLHDYCHALWQVGGYKEILSLQGGYFGYALMILAWIILNWEYLVKKLKR